MPPRPIITLTTDFGLADGTVGAMVGVIKSICPDADVVNVASNVPPHDIARGAWALMQAAPFFPKESIHIAVVDPGVGTDRRGLVAVTEHGTFLGPDNGLLSWAVRRVDMVEWRALENPAYRIAPVGVTFEGRDLFAPAAAHLAAGADPAEFGPVITNPAVLRWPQPQMGDDHIDGEILIVDYFGNLVTNVPLVMVADLCGERAFQVILPAARSPHPGQHRTATDPAPFARSYDEIRGKLGAVINGVGLIEIAAKRGSAAAVAGRGRGDRISVRLQGGGK